MPGTIVITGANGSIAMPTIQYLLEHSPTYTLVLTVRSAAESDVNTQKLRAILDKHTGANTKVSLQELDLTSMAAVAAFSNKIVSEIAAGTLPPIIAILCNAYYWNLIEPAAATPDGFERTFQVNHIAHGSIVLRLLGSFDKTVPGRVLIFPSDGIEPGRNMFEKFPPNIPNEQDALDALVKMGIKDGSDDYLAYGFQRYANSKLAAVMWGLALDKYLKKVCLSFSPFPVQTLICE
jgi:NAD(P)-dependent dehydrogenase (short-subunit alcohol dehydrogenase family)